LDQPLPPDAAPAPLAAGGWRQPLCELAQMLRFYSRIPVPQLPFENDPHAIPDFASAPRLLPVAGLLIGLPGALALWLASWLGLPAMVAAALAVAAAVLVTGAFHEDGLADTFDGLGGGWTSERRLEIMKDSRIGTYGGAALLLALILRVTALAALTDETGATSAALVMLAAAPVSRCIGLMPITLLPPARPEGLSSAAGRPSLLLLAGTLAIAFAAACALIAAGGAPMTGAILGAILGLALAAVMTLWAWRAIKGQTGDIAGACQQLAEIAFYLGVLVSV
jgi:adenosylcobinamide-GDP ribazoletransferase